MKQSMPTTNGLCPQSLFVYGTYGEDGKPNFGQFCWVSYYWGKGLGVMATICENKRTRDNIRARGVFSMGLVTEELLPLADYFGNKPGYEGDKMDIPAAIEKGRVLDVPVLEQCPFTLELEVSNIFREGEAEVYLCAIRNVLAEDFLCGDTLSHEEKLRRIRPVQYAMDTYFKWDGSSLAKPGEPGRAYRRA
jgi:flavin reductase (DIM6/NTAB) family NADH-FMN oxidoreductase RutF